MAPPVVTFDQNVLPLAAGATQRRWVLPFKVFNMPAGLTLSRYVTFKVDGIDWALAYQLASPSDHHYMEPEAGADHRPEPDD